MRTRVWFADELPGPPVRMEMYTKGERDFEMVMTEHHAGGEPPAAE